MSVRWSSFRKNGSSWWPALGVSYKWQWTRRSSTCASAKRSAGRFSTIRRSISSWRSSKLEIESVRALLYQALESYLVGENVTKLAAISKYLIGRLSMEIPAELSQFWGGQGFMNESFISRLNREARQTAVGGGANEVMLQVVAKEIGILSKAR